MACAEYRLLISRYLDGDLEAEEIAHLNNHLARCPDCVRYMARLQHYDSRIRSAPQRDTDPGERARLMASIASLDRKQPQEIAITRRSETPVAPYMPPRFSWRSAFNGLAAGTAMLVLLATGLLIWQMNAIPSNPTPIIGNTEGPGGPLGTAEATLQAYATPDLPSVQATQQAVAVTGPTNIFASPTAGWEIAAEPTTVANHAVSDERFGYSITYPASWWTSRVAVTDTATSALSRRVIKPWPVGQQDLANLTVSIEVRDNSKHLTLADVAALAGRNTRPVHYGGLSGIQAPQVAPDDYSDDVYLLGGGLIYRFQLFANPSADSQLSDVADAWQAAEADFQTILESFAVSSASNYGAAPLLFLRGRDLWRYDAASGKEEQVAVPDGGAVYDFALSPDLQNVAVINGLNRQSSDPYGRVLNIISPQSDKIAPREIWRAQRVYDVAWYDDHRLVAITKPSDEAFGVYLLDDYSAGTHTLLAKLPDNLDAPRNLQVSPDRLWISFLAGQGASTMLYRVAKDGGQPDALELTGDCNEEQITDYGWLEPNDKSGVQRLMLLADGKPLRLTAYPADQHETDCEELAPDGASSLAVSPEGRAAILAYRNGQPVVQVADGTWSAMSLNFGLTANTPAPVASKSAELFWLPNSRYLAVHDLADGGKAAIQLLDLGTH